MTGTRFLTSKDQLHESATLFLKALEIELKTSGFNFNELDVDHICYRVTSLDRYESAKKEINALGTILAESPVNGRPICTFRLHDPIVFEWTMGATRGSLTIALLELPAPKPDSHYAEGFEHIEAVTREDFDSIEERHSKLIWTRGGDRNINPELVLTTRAGKLKFHYQPLDRVIEIEQAEFTDILFDFDGTLLRTHSFGAVTEELIPGMREVLEFLKSKNVSLHLWTARDPRSGRRILKDLEISGFFETLSFASDLHLKPDPKGLEFDWKQAHPHSVLMIGDSSTDIIGAKAIGAVAAGVVWNSPLGAAPLITLGADLIFYDPQELLNWLKSKYR